METQTRQNPHKELGAELFGILQAITKQKRTLQTIPIENGKFERALYMGTHGNAAGNTQTLTPLIEFPEEQGKGLYCKNLEDMIQGGIETGSITQIPGTNNYTFNETPAKTSATYDAKELSRLAHYIHQHITYTRG